MLIDRPDLWSGNWAWGLPIIVLTVLAHAFGLLAIHERLIASTGKRADARRTALRFATVISVTVILVTLLHGFEATVWATAYLALGALGDGRSAMLYSLSAMTAYGHENFFLEPHWRLMGALEALNGLILFGLTTAFLFSVLQRNWPTPSPGRGSAFLPEHPAEAPEWDARAPFVSRPSGVARAQAEPAASDGPSAPS